MKYIVGSILALVTSVVYPQESPAGWRLTEVQSVTNETLGYIYHSYSIGTQKSELPASGTPNKVSKIVSGLRFICSIKGHDTPPLIAIYWHNQSNDYDNTDPLQNPVWMVDGHVYSYPQSSWVREESLLYRPIGITSELINALKAGKRASVTWTDTNHITRSTIFDLTNFSTGLARFNIGCGTSI